VRELRGRERFVQHHAARRDGRTERWKQVPLQISGDDHQIESRLGQRILPHVGAPARHAQSRCCGGRRRVAHRIDVDVHAERAIPGARQHQRVPSPPHRDVERAARFARIVPRSRGPFDDEW
jgi:hypothetical protein